MKNLNKVTSSLVCAILFMGSANASLPETWYEKEVGERKIKKSYQKIAKSYSDEDLKEIFDSRKLQACDLNVLRELNKLDTKYLDDAVIRANKLGYIDEIETDILLQYAEAMDSVPKRMESNSFRIRKGKKRVEDMYRNLFAGDHRQNVESNRSSRRTRAFSPSMDSNERARTETWTRHERYLRALPKRTTSLKHRTLFARSSCRSRNYRSTRARTVSITC